MKTKQKSMAWAEKAKSLTAKMLERQEIITDLNFYANWRHGKDTQDEQKEQKAALKSLTREIAALTNELAVFEQENGVGAAALLDKSAEKLTVRVMALLATARFHPKFERDIQTVGNLIELAAGNDTKEALSIRELFRTGSPIRPYVYLQYEEVLDHSDVVLRESALNRMLQQPPDSAEILMDTEATRRRWH
jgi:hypothetical protein